MLKLFLLIKILLNKRILEIQRKNERDPQHIYKMVTIEALSIEVKKFELDNQNKYLTNTGEELLIQQKDIFGINYVDYAITVGCQIDNAIIGISKRKNLIVTNKKVISLENKNELNRRKSKIYVKHFG